MDLTRRDWLGLAMGTGMGTFLGVPWRAGAVQNEENGVMLPQPLPRVVRFERLAYGMFIHWGLYSQLGRGEWVMNLERIPVAEYAKLRDTFTASDFDGRAIARAARIAGMRYITLTARHHEGFSLYDTRGLSDYDSMHAPAGRDLVAEFVEGCRAEDIVPMLYHTTLDWYQPSFEKDFDAYLDYLHASVELLCTHYGQLGGLWFDGNWSKSRADWKEDRLYGIIRKLQPEAMIINNTGIHQRGALGHPEIDSTTFEQGRPEPMDRAGMPKYISAEMCQTMNMHWGRANMDFNYMAPREVIENLCACRKVGANYLLNVGPSATGQIPDYEKACLERAGEWVAMHAEAVYDGKPCGIAGPDGDFGLEANGKHYLFIHNLAARGGEHVTPETGGAGSRRFDGVPEGVRAAHWVDSGESLRFDRDGGAFMLRATRFPYGTNTVVRVARLES
jgi:alpha-L-fucosidase